MTPHEFGKKCEDIAARYLTQNGFTLLVQNFQSKKGYKVGEIDIVCQKDNALHFVEVKSRHVRSKNGSFHVAFGAITRRKILSMERSIQQYLRKEQLEDVEYHIDAIAILYYKPESTYRLSYIHDIFV